MNKDDLRTTLFAIFIMAMCFAAAFCCSCNSNERHHPSTISSEQYCEQQGAEEIYPFNFSNVDDALYSSEDFAFFLEYGDSTTFNYDELAEITGRDFWYGKYILVDIYDSLVSEFLEDFGDFYYYNKIEGNLPKCNQLNNKYAIVQYNAEGDFLWILEKVPENFKW